MSSSVTVRLPEAATAVAPTGFGTPVSSTLPAAIERIVETVQPRKIILFGSYAYGTPTPDSDVDLLVIMETTAPRAQRYVTVSQVLWPRQFPVDIVVRTPEELRQALMARDPFITEIVEHGQVVYEQPG
jgi:predicted nucleotidyltransferase